MTRPSCIAPHIPSLLLRRWCSLGQRGLFANPGLDEKVFNVDDRCVARCAGNAGTARISFELHVWVK